MTNSSEKKQSYKEKYEALVALQVEKDEQIEFLISRVDRLTEELEEANKRL